MGLLLEGSFDVETWADALVIAVVAGGAGGIFYLVATLMLGLREPWMMARRLPLVRWLVPASLGSD